MLAEQVRGILIENLALAVGERNSHADHHEYAGCLSGRRIVGERRCRGGEHGAAQSRIRGVTAVVENAVVSARRKLADHGSSKHLLDAVAERLILERRDGDGPDVLRKLHDMTGGVITASHTEEDEEEAEPKQARRTRRH